jgi:hypothetical protein
MATFPNDGEAFFLLAQWCTVAKAWKELPQRFDAMHEAEQAATERGIYRVTLWCEGEGSTWYRSREWGRNDCQPPTASAFGPARTPATPRGRQTRYRPTSPHE